MNLYHINSLIEDCMTVDAETGEVTFDEERLSELQMMRENKLENIALWIKNLAAEAEAIKREKLALAERQSYTEKQAERLRKYLSDALAGQKFNTPRVSVGFRKATRVEINDDVFYSSGNMDYCKTKVEPDKTKIKDALKQGFPVRGAALVDTMNMTIK